MNPSAIASASRNALNMKENIDWSICGSTAAAKHCVFFAQQSFEKRLWDLWE
jgi:hypothetical protein